MKQYYAVKLKQIGDDSDAAMPSGDLSLQLRRQTWDRQQEYRRY